MEFRTEICDLLNIRYPLLQGAMAWIAGGKLAGAVSEAGGLGVIGAGSADTEIVRKEIELARQMTNQPFAVNLMMTSPYIDELVNLVITEKIPIVTSGGGNPGRFMEPLKAAGTKVIPVVSSVALARRLVRSGADALIAEGMESGGHVGEMTTMALVPMVVDAVDVPVIAAGGIADGRGFMAALALGAQGVQMGTRFICANECKVHPSYQQKIIEARDRSTVVCGTTTGHPVRAIHNPFTRMYLNSERSGASAEELDKLGQGRYPAASVHGDLQDGSILCGQICGLVKSIQPAGDIVRDIILDACRVKEQLGGIICRE